MIKRLFAMLVAFLVLYAHIPALAAELSEMRDGYYAAEEREFNEYGWKEFMTIYVRGGKIVTVEYDAKNASGFVRSWDMAYMSTMRITDGTYPNEYTREYKISLLNWQDPEMVDAVSGATSSHTAFQALAEAAISQARKGDKQVAIVDVDYHAQETPKE